MSFKRLSAAEAGAVPAPGPSRSGAHVALKQLAVGECLEFETVVQARRASVGSTRLKHRFGMLFVNRGNRIWRVS